MTSCKATTKKGNPCPIAADEDSEFCHVHNPEKQCGFINAKGKRCGIPTGGRGPCPHHINAYALPPKPSRSRRRVHAKPTSRVEKRQAEEARIDRVLAELAELY